MNDSTVGSDKKKFKQASIPYEKAREFLEGHDFEKLIHLASDETSFPEMLYFLSSDDDPEIRTRVAANPSTPIQADEVLSKDTETVVRQAVGGKIARRLPALPRNDSAQRSAAIAILEHLIEDEEVRVRRIIADELKTTDSAPLHIIQKLARDVDEIVSRPILHHSPILADEELITIIEDSAISFQLKAIAERKNVSEPLAECIVETADVEAISQLLLNPSAQIRESTLDQLLDSAKDITEWHEPLVMREKLPFGAIRKIADFVAGSLIEILSQRNDINEVLREDLEQRVMQRLSEENDASGEVPSESLDDIEHRLRELYARGELNEKYVRGCIGQGDRNCIILSLAILADISTIISRRIFASLSAKTIMALCWKAGVSASLATRIQSVGGNISANDWILPNEEEGYPFSESQMQWQLALFLDQEEEDEPILEKPLKESVF